MFGFEIPLWAIFVAVILIVFVVWKFIKFAIKILIVLVVFFAILIGLDFLDVFSTLQRMLSSFL